MNAFDDSIASDLKAEDYARRRYETVLKHHPDCRDPEHPGCDLCDGDYDDQEMDGEEE